ncbi:hypothetical protein [Cupriavidus necator]
MKKILAIIFWLHSISHTFAATLCDSDAMACMLYSERSGSLVDRDTGKVVAHRIGNVGAFSDVSVYKYGNQYAIVQENHSNDRLVTAVPLTRENGIWSFDSVYYFSISLIESSAQTGPRWLARKLHTRKSVVDDDILLRAGELASERRTSPTKPDGWPNTKLYLATDDFSMDRLTPKSYPASGVQGTNSESFHFLFMHRVFLISQYDFTPPFFILQPLDG